VNPQSTGNISVVAWGRDHISYIGEIEVTGTGIEGTSIGGPSNSITAACPSPATSSTTVAFTLASTGRVNVEVYDLSGRSVGTLFSGQMTGGGNSVDWDLLDDDGRPVPSGLYTIRVSSSHWNGNTQLLVVR
jgi:flagellar hook assembly protein FlgD